MKNALLVIDVQEGFFANNENPVYQKKRLIENINRLIEKFRQNKEPIIFIRHTEEKGEELEKGSQAWQVYSKLQSKPEDYFVDKATPDSFLNTNLTNIIAENKISMITITGLQSDYCIDTTCRSAFGKKINTILVSDAHSSYDNSYMKAEKIIDYHNKLLGGWFAKLKTTDDLV